MRFHPNLLHFGRLELFEVYAYYDAPVLISCRSATGNLFLAVALDEDDDDAEEWLYVPLSRERLLEVRSGGIDLRTAFAVPEDGLAFVARIPHDQERIASVTPTVPANLSDDMLPSPGEYLRLGTTSLPALDKARERARQTRRDILKIAIKLPELLRTEAPAKILGNMLSTLQDLIYAIGQSLKGEPGRRGTQKRKITISNELMVLAFGDGSFEVELASAQYADLYDTSDASAPLAEFVSIIQDGSNADALQAHLKRLKARAAGDYLRFLRSIEKRVDHTVVEWASPSGEERRAEMSGPTVRAAIAIIEDERLEEKERFSIPGVLIGANIDKQTYEVWHARDHDERYEGKIAREGVDSVRGATIGQTYRIHLRLTVRVKISTGEALERVELVFLEPLGDESTPPAGHLPS